MISGCYIERNNIRFERAISKRQLACTSSDTFYYKNENGKSKVIAIKKAPLQEPFSRVSI